MVTRSSSSGVGSVRLLILGSSIAPHWRGTPLRFRVLASAVLIDPTFNKGDRRYRSGVGGGHAHYLGAAAAMAIAWHLAILVGALLGAIVPPSAHLEWVLLLVLLAELIQRLQSQRSGSRCRPLDRERDIEARSSTRPRAACRGLNLCAM